MINQDTSQFTTQEGFESTTQVAPALTTCDLGSPSAKSSSPMKLILDMKHIIIDMKD